MAPWGSAASLDCWIARCYSPRSTCPAPVSAVSPSRRVSKKCKVSCVSVPRELATAAEQTTQAEEEGVMCEGCSGRGWLLCDFCKGKKNNVQSKGSRIYRRCPTCKAAGYVLCSKCRVYKCITFPDSTDGEL